MDTIVHQKLVSKLRKLDFGSALLVQVLSSQAGSRPAASSSPLVALAQALRENEFVREVFVYRE